MNRRAKTWLALAAVLVGVLVGSGMVWLSLTEAGTVEAAFSASGLKAERRGMGPTAAPVQIVIYFDFQCGHCENLHRGTEAQIISQYVATGQAHLEARALPFLGRESQRAAEAAACAADRGQYWEYRDALFNTWRRYGPTVYSQAGLTEVARQVGLDASAFSSCLTSGAKRGEVEADLREADSLGINAVPVVFVNGRKLEGALSFERFAQVIEEVLAK